MFLQMILKNWIFPIHCLSCFNWKLEISSHYFKMGIGYSWIVQIYFNKWWKEQRILSSYNFMNTTVRITMQSDTQDNSCWTLVLFCCCWNCLAIVSPTGIWSFFDHLFLAYVCMWFWGQKNLQTCHMLIVDVLFIICPFNVL